MTPHDQATLLSILCSPCAILCFFLLAHMSGVSLILIRFTKAGKERSQVCLDLDGVLTGSHIVQAI